MIDGKERHKAKNITHNSNAIMEHEMYANKKKRKYLINTGASILENFRRNETLPEAELVKRFIHKMNKPGAPCSDADGKPARFILRVLMEAHMIDRDVDHVYTSTLQGMIKFGGPEQHDFKECMTGFFEKYLRAHPNPRKSPRKSCPIKDDEFDEFFRTENAEDIAMDSFASKGDVSTARDDGIIQNGDEGCKKRLRTAKDDASNSAETRKKKNTSTARPRVARTFSAKQTIQHSVSNLTTTASGGVRTELTHIQQNITFNFPPNEFSTTTTTDVTAADYSRLGSVLLKTSSLSSFEISSNSACTTNQDILDTDADADLSALGTVLLKTTSENSVKVTSNSPLSFDNPSEV